MRTFAIVLALAALFAVASAQQSQAFLLGYHIGLNLGAKNTQIIALNINDRYLNPESLEDHLTQISSNDSDTRLVGLQSLYSTFSNFASHVRNIITQDQIFTIATNYTLTLLSSPQDFLHRADVLRKKSGYDVFASINRAASLARNGDFYNSGMNFGWVILSLRNVVAPPLV